MILWRLIKIWQLVAVEEAMNILRFIGGRRLISPVIDKPIDGDTPLDKILFAIVDSETTGLDVMRDRMVSFAGIAFQEGERQAESIEIMINPEMKMPKISLAVHGISDDMVRDKPNFNDSWHDIHGFLEGKVIVGHHIAFDISFLHRQAHDAGWLWQPQYYLDTGLLMAALNPDFPSQDLDEMIKFYNMDSHSYARHTALGDALIAADFFAILLREMQKQGITTLQQATDFQETRKGIISRQRDDGWYDWQGHY